MWFFPQGQHITGVCGGGGLNHYQAPVHHLERRGFEGDQNEAQALFRGRERTGLVDREPAGAPRLPIEAPRGERRVARRLEGRDSLVQLIECQAGQIHELHGASLPIGEPYTGHLWYLLLWEAQHTTIEINSIDCHTQLMSATC